MEDLFIFKFGGSCLKNKEAMEQSLKILNHYKSKGKIIAVTSAFYGVTNQLLNWVGFSSDERTEQESKEQLEKIHVYHNDIVEGTIGDDNIKKEVFSYLDERFKELDAKIPAVMTQKENAEIMDFVLSYGERLSTYIYSRYLRDQGFDSEYFSGDDGLIYTNPIFGNALPLLDKIDISVPERMTPSIEKGAISVFSGYYGTTEDGRVSTLGRGGTDFTATIIAYAFAQKYNVKVIFWKDVYGLLSANPKFEPHAKLVSHISFKEAKELAFFGSKILHPLCLNTAQKRNIKVELRNYTDPFTEKCTTISNNSIEQAGVIKAITALEKIDMVTIEGEAMVSLPGTAARIFSLIGEYNINVNFISQSSSENNITFGVAGGEGFRAGEALANSKYFGNRWLNIKVDHDASLVAVVGAGMECKKGIAGKVFTALGNAGVNVRAIAQGSSELNITFVINRDDVAVAVQTLYHNFIQFNGRI